MTPYQSSFGTIIQINFKLLLAAAMIFVAYYSWPTSAKWYGFGLISICAGLAAIGLVIEAVRAMTKLYVRDKTLAEFEKLGNKPKSSTLVTDDAMRQAGLFDE